MLVSVLSRWRWGLISLVVAASAQAQDTPYPTTGPSNEPPPEEVEPPPERIPPKDIGPQPEYRERKQRGRARAVEEPHREGEYGGVVPPGKEKGRKKKSRRPTVTWIGFQASDGGARVFLQMTGEPKVEQKRVLTKLIVTVHNARLNLRNNARTLETAYFGTAVAKVRARTVRRRGKRAVEVHVLFKGPAQEAQTTTEVGVDGYRYLYLDFGGGTAADGT